MITSKSQRAVCGEPWDARIFDETGVHGPPRIEGQTVELARHRLHPQYCGTLTYFALLAKPQSAELGSQLIVTPGLEWTLLCNQRPLDPYPPTSLILNPWGAFAPPIDLRLEEGCELRLVVKKVAPPAGVTAVEPELVAGRIQGRYWYNAAFGGQDGGH